MPRLLNTTPSQLEEEPLPSWRHSRGVWAIGVISLSAALMTLHSVLRGNSFPMDPTSMSSRITKSQDNVATIRVTNSSADGLVVQLQNEVARLKSELSNKFVAPETTPAVSTADNSLLPPEVINPNLLIDGKSYSLDQLDMNGKPIPKPLNNDTTGAELFALLPLPKPIIVVGMPKAGTSSIFDFFRKSGYRSVHWRPPGPPDTQRVGECMRRAVEQGKPLLQSCGNFEVWAQIDVTDVGMPGSSCYYPQILNLPELHQEAPNATFILNRRDFSAWADSVDRWGSLRNRLPKCTPFGPKSTDKLDLMDWHRQQIMRIRQFVHDHPSHALIEVDVEHPATAMRMSKAFQIHPKHWGKSNANG